MKTKTRKTKAKSKIKSKAKAPKKAKRAGKKKLRLSARASAMLRKLTSKKKRKAKSNDRWITLSWLVPVAVFVAGVAVLKQPKTQFAVPHVSAHLETMFQNLKSAPNQDINEKVAFWSESLLTKPNLLSALGAGPDINDTAPLFPPAYDCTTYVEMVGALARSRTTEEIADRLISIRYKNGKIGYMTRNHFPEADWIPNNTQAGNLSDITVQISRKAGFMASFANKDIDKLAWFKDQRNEHADRALANVNAVSSEPTTVRLPYIPLDRAQVALPHIPQGAIINIVRENKERYPVLISHQGFLIWKNGVAYFRHASRNKQITEMPLSKYLKTSEKMPWKVLGLNVNAFSES